MNETHITYTLQETSLFDTSNIPRLDSDDGGNGNGGIVSNQFHLFSISHSKTIDWDTKTYQTIHHTGCNVNDIMVNFNHYTYPKNLKKLNAYFNKDIQLSSFNQKFSIFKKKVLLKLKEYYALSPIQLYHIVIAPMLNTHKKCKFGIFVLNDMSIIKIMTRHYDKNSYTTLSTLVSRQQTLSLIKNIKFIKRIETIDIKCNHHNKELDLGDCIVPFPIIVNNISGYFPLLETIESKLQRTSLKLKNVNE